MLLSCCMYPTPPSSCAKRCLLLTNPDAQEQSQGRGRAAGDNQPQPRRLPAAGRARSLHPAVRTERLPQAREPAGNTARLTHCVFLSKMLVLVCKWGSHRKMSSYLKTHCSFSVHCNVSPSRSSSSTLGTAEQIPT